VGDPYVQSISSEADVVAAGKRASALAADIGFAAGDQTVIVAALSAVARNIVQHAGRGEVIVQPVHAGERVGVQITARDHGPGIADVYRALLDGFSTSGGSGLGIPVARRLMDEFDVTSEPGNGTTVEMKKWRG
jgi:serine/threonine-protein kinase RsbT